MESVSFHAVKILPYLWPWREHILHFLYILLQTSMDILVDAHMDNL